MQELPRPPTIPSLTGWEDVSYSVVKGKRQDINKYPSPISGEEPPDLHDTHLQSRALPKTVAANSLSTFCLEYLEITFSRNSWPK